MWYVVSGAWRRACRRLEVQQMDVDRLSWRSTQRPRRVQRAAVRLLGDHAGQVLVSAGHDWHRHWTSLTTLLLVLRHHCTCIRHYIAIPQEQTMAQRVMGNGSNGSTNVNGSRVSTVKHDPWLGEVRTCKRLSIVCSAEHAGAWHAISKKYNCEKRASNIALSYGVEVDKWSFECFTSLCLYLM